MVSPFCYNPNAFILLLLLRCARNAYHPFSNTLNRWETKFCPGLHLRISSERAVKLWSNLPEESV